MYHHGETLTFTITQKWYATLRHLKNHPHTKFGIPISNERGDMARTRSVTDGRTESGKPIVPQTALRPLGD